MTKTCTAETLQRLAQQRTEITSQEKIFEGYFEMLKQNRFDENTGLDGLEHSANTFNKIFLINLSTSEFNGAIALKDYLQQLSAGTVWLKLNANRLQLFLLPEFTESNEVTDFLENLIEICSRTAATLNKAQKLVPTDKKVEWNSDLQDLITQSEGLIDKVAKIIHDSASLASSHLSTNGKSMYNFTKS